MVIDTHCHLDMIDHNLDLVLDRARSNGVKRCITISTSIESISRVHEITNLYSNVYCALGVHPCYVNSGENLPEDMIENFTNAENSKVVAIGETGIDRYHNDENLHHQKLSFVQHINLARKLNLPVVIHARNADEDVISTLLYEYKRAEFSGILHCFASGEKLARVGINLNMYISFSGILTYNNAEEVRRIAAMVPQDKLLVETDSPYLIPKKYRKHGIKHNEPYCIKEILSILATIHNKSVEEMDIITTENSYKAFPRMQ